MPEPLKAEAHAQVKLPGVSVQAALTWQLCVPVLHSLMFVHKVPEPQYPEAHAHVKLPGVSVQVALTWQLCVPVLHSLMFVTSESPPDN